MAKLINIDKFKDSVIVELDGKKYDIKTLTVKEYINESVTGRLDTARKSGGLKSYVDTAVHILKERSNMPQNVLENLTITQMEAALLALQGIDPNALQIFSGDGDGGGK